MYDIDLSPEEIDRICHPLKQNAAKVRFLRSLGVTDIRQRPDGTPLVARSHYEAVRGGGQRQECAQPSQIV